LERESNARVGKGGWGILLVQDATQKTNLVKLQGRSPWETTFQNNPRREKGRWRKIESDEAKTREKEARKKEKSEGIQFAIPQSLKVEKAPVLVKKIDRFHGKDRAKRSKEKKGHPRRGKASRERMNAQGPHTKRKDGGSMEERDGQSRF